MVVTKGNQTQKMKTKIVCNQEICNESHSCTLRQPYCSERQVCWNPFVCSSTTENDYNKYYVCRCSGKCDKLTGKCLTGICLPNWYGEKCDQYYVQSKKLIGEITLKEGKSYLNGQVLDQSSVDLYGKWKDDTCLMNLDITRIKEVDCGDKLRFFCQKNMNSSK